MGGEGLHVPWEPWPCGWRLGTADEAVGFDSEGMRVVATQEVASRTIGWKDLSAVSVSIGWHSRARDAFEVISPKPTPGLAHSGRIEVVANTPSGDLVLDVPMTGPCSWQVQFVLDDLLRLLARRLSLLGVPGLVDSAVAQVAAQVKARSRVLMNTDLLGLDRFVGGHGAYDGALRAVVASLVDEAPL